MIELIAFDGDDTLWHSESHFTEVEGAFAAILRPYVGDELDVSARHYATERRNLELFGYGVKGFTLSMIETAIEATDGAITTDDISRILDLGKALLSHPVDLIDGVADTLTRIADRGYRLVLVTKGDLFHQEQKVAASGIADRFELVEIVSEKDETTYRRIMGRCAVAPTRFLMVGNSVRSDVLPVVALGGHAVHIPYEVTWGHEVVDDHDGGFDVLERFTDLPAWLSSRS